MQSVETKLSQRQKYTLIIDRRQDCTWFLAATVVCVCLNIAFLKVATTSTINKVHVYMLHTFPNRVKYFREFINMHFRPLFSNVSSIVGTTVSINIAYCSSDSIQRDFTETETFAKVPK